MRDDLRRQVQKNMMVINNLRLTGIQSEHGPVLKVQRKNIATTDKQKTLNEKA
jgi:hypothetical protein